jgi:hypothetical protein
MLHDPVFRSSIEARLEALRPDAPRKWGSMTSDQMLWHVNQFLSFALGEGSFQQQKTPLPVPLFRLILLYMPWPRSAPTHRDALAKDSHDFEAERTRCRGLIDRFANRPLDGTWPVDPLLGAVTGRYTSKLQAKHLDYHFRQFSG